MRDQSSARRWTSISAGASMTVLPFTDEKAPADSKIDRSYQPILPGRMASSIAYEIVLRKAYAERS
jgi:hypothetical protein